METHLRVLGLILGSAMILYAALLASPLVSEASPREPSYGRERSRFFVEINGGITRLYTAEQGLSPYSGTLTPSGPEGFEIYRYTETLGSVSGKLGYFLKDSIGVYLGTSLLWDEFATLKFSVTKWSVGTVYFFGNRGLTPYIYGEFQSDESIIGGNYEYGVGIGGGIPIYRWLSVDTSLSLSIPWNLGYDIWHRNYRESHRYPLDYIIKEATSVKLTLGISLWLF